MILRMRHIVEYFLCVCMSGVYESFTIVVLDLYGLCFLLTRLYVGGQSKIRNSLICMILA